MAEQVLSALRSGKAPEAEALLRKRLAVAPNDADALFTLADIVAQHDSGEALALLYRALEVAPGWHAVPIALSSIHLQRLEFPPALDLLRQVPAELRQSFELKTREAAILGCLGRRDEEIALYRDLVRGRPRDAGLWMSLGNALNYAGDTAEAIAALRRSTRIAPAYGEPWWSLANLKSFRFDDSDVREMESLLGSKLPAVDALHFHFALGRAFEERGDYGKSFAHYSAGNATRAAGLPPKPVTVTRFVDAAIEAFTPELFARIGESGHPSDEPIFVIGLQRSGSTLIEQILASHPEVEATSELMTMQHLWDALGGFEAIARADPSVFRKIGEEYLARTAAFRQLGRRRFVDKLPANWMNVGLIRLILPNARIIDSRRHPMACGFSNFKQHFATGVTFAYSLESIGRFYRDYLRLMRHFDAVQPGAIRHVIHERLVEDPEAEIRRMLEFLGLPFDPACVDFHKTRRAVHTPSAEQVRQPISREGLDHWRHYEPWLDPLKKALGPALADWQK